MNSALQKTMQRKDDEFTKVHGLGRCRFVERIGTKLIDLVGTKDPWGASPCEREACWSCKHEPSAGLCRVEGITYSIVCLGCLEVGILSEYSGESSRDMFQRGAEHQSGLANEDPENALWKHCASMHSGAKQEFQMRLMARHNTPFERLIAESVNITDGVRDNNLNSKA